MTIGKPNKSVLEQVPAIKNAAATSDELNISKSIPTSQPTLLTVNQLCLVEPALTRGGVRHLLFTKGHDLPGVYRFGRKLLFDRSEFMTGIKEGHTATISGRGDK